MSEQQSSEEALIESNIEEYLARHERKELVRFVAVGSVDDGKSTLIGRLLHDTKGVYEDQLAAVKKASKGGAAEEIDFALITDGLKAEREQGITIDVAYRYFSTEKRKFIIADTPGHVQYTRNMATGASTADVAIILLDARLGVLPQSRRHAYIASLLGIRHLLVAVNKMDLVEWRRERFEELQAEFGAFVAGLDFSSVAFFPISAKQGDNVVHRSFSFGRMDWWGGGTLLEWLETVPVERDRADEPLRFPVQTVIRPHQDYRGFAGQIASGLLRKGDEIAILPSGRRARVKAIDIFEGELDEAPAPLSVTVRLDREVDCSRGDMLVAVEAPPRTERRFDAMVVWLSERALDPRRQLLLKQTTRLVPARVERVQWRMDLERLEQAPSSGLQLNDIARVTVGANRPIFVDAYAKNRVTGAFILIDALANDTVGAGMILDGAPAEEIAARAGEPVSAAEREARMGQRGAVLLLDGGDASLARAVERSLYERGLMPLVVDAATLPAGSLGALVERCVEAALAVIVVGGEHAAERIAPDRVVDGAAIGSDPGLLADALDRAASRTDP